MKVYFSTSASNIVDNIDSCRVIISTVKKLGHELTRDWVEEAYHNNIVGHEYTESESKKIYQDNIRALKEADVVILEASTFTFNTGYLAGKAINLQKPLLILTKSLHKTSFLMGESTTLKSVEIFLNNSDIENLVTNFLNENALSNKEHRFNMYIGRNISNYLGRESKKTGKSKAQLVREILESHIINSDN